MRQAKQIFAVTSILLYAFYAGGVLLDGGAPLKSALAYAFPSGEGMHYFAGEAAYYALPYRTDLLEGHARLQNLIGKTESGGLDVVAATGRSFVAGADSGHDDYRIELYAAGLRRLEETLRKEGARTKVTYISAQSQVVNGYTESPRGFPLPQQYLLMESMLYYLRAYNVDFLDTQYVLQRSDLSPSDYIYKTDTKWTTEASFVAAQALIGKLHGQYGLDISPGSLFSSEQFDRKTYSGVLTGNMGMRAGRSFTGGEDFTVLLPNYETELTYQALDADEPSVSGAFEEALLRYEHLQPLDPYSYSAYSVYMGGGIHPNRKITNHALHGTQNVLFVHDASALPFASFISLGFGETHMYWPAIAEDAYSFDLVNYVVDNDIDYVFFMSECDPYALEGIFSVLPKEIPAG
ncbi:hypothetical protein LJC34_03045 [Oscillospiraceae bacterium OttesenSCG-928-G22]|nr:hypothetical protein [Oscillospiraceae bacterium OttesenSCG-928-G22]